jgi:predicted metal-binding protein
LVQEWHDSAHGQQGINCYDCHKANKDDPGAFEHNGFVIHVIVSPKDCGACHPKEVEQLPEMKQVAGEPLADQLMEKYVYTQPGHLWLKEGMNKEQLQKIEEFYRNRYGAQGEGDKK